MGVCECAHGVMRCVSMRGSESGVQAYLVGVYMCVYTCDIEFVYIGIMGGVWMRHSYGFCTGCGYVVNRFVAHVWRGCVCGATVGA